MYPCFTEEESEAERSLRIQLRLPPGPDVRKENRQIHLMRREAGCVLLLPPLAHNPGEGQSPPALAHCSAPFWLLSLSGI